MKKSRIKFITAFIAVIGFALAAIACTPKNKPEDKVYDWLVTYNYNVGKIEANCPDQFVGVKTGSLLKVKPGYNSNIADQPVEGYYLEGWYLPKVDENGEPIVNEDERVELDRKWDFDTETVTKDLTLYANLVANPKLKILGGDKEVEFNGNPGKTEVRPNNARLRPSKNGWTFTGYYEDSEYQTKFDVSAFTYGYEDKTVYAKFIEGDWFGKLDGNNEFKFVETAAEFKTALSQKKSIKLENDIDFTDVDWSAPTTFNVELDGNGKSLTNIKYDVLWTRTSVTNNSLFGALGEKANIHDLNIVSAQMTFTFVASNGTLRPNVALFANTIAAGAKLTDVTVTGALTLSEFTQAAFDELNDVKADINENKGTLEDCDFSGIEYTDPVFKQE